MTIGQANQNAIWPAVRFFPKNRGLCIDKESSNDSVAVVTSDIAGAKFTAGQVTQNTKWPAV